jgi:hypothetical protein
MMKRSNMRVDNIALHHRMFGYAAPSAAASFLGQKMSAASSREYLKANDYRAQMSMPAGF